MNIADKKKELIQALQQSDDEQLIDEVYELVHPTQAIDILPVTSLPKQLQDKIERGLDDYENGRYITHDELRQKVQQWLTK